MKTLLLPFYLMFLLLLSCEKDNIAIKTIELDDVTIKCYPNGIKDVYDMFFADESTGFVVGHDGMIKKTTDAGITWETLKSGTNVDLNTVAFINKYIGYVGSDYIRDGNHFNSLIIKTIDGGLSWTIDTIPNVARFTDIWFFNENDGIAYLMRGDSETVSITDAVFITNDQGATWENLNLNVTLNNWTWDRIFVTNNVCDIIGGDNNNILYQSKDFGKTWISIQTPATIDGLDFVSNDISYITDRGKIYKTENSGAVWNKITIPYHVGLFHFFDNMKGINIDYATEIDGDGYKLVGSIIMTTTDGGLNWKASATQDIIGGHYSFPSQKMGFCVSDKGFYAIEFK